MQLVMMHGLYMHHTIMKPLSALMETLGWQIEGLSYNSLNIDLNGLFDRIEALCSPDTPCYLVGHSLGGVLARQYAEQRPLPEGSRIVSLGSPHQGAQVAKQLAQWNLQGFMGNAHEHGLINDGELTYGGTAALGSLAGDAGVGVGNLFSQLQGQPNDGTVLVSETQIEGMSDHLVLPVSHTSMLLSPQVARQTDHFLRYGRFDQG